MQGHTLQTEYQLNSFVFFKLKIQGLQEELLDFKKIFHLLAKINPFTCLLFKEAGFKN